MNHQKAYRKLGRNPSHRRATLRNLATALVLNERIETTLPKAKELRRVADRLVTLGKKNTLHSRRQALSYLIPINREQAGKADKTSAVHKLFEEIAPRFAERNGGYTRVIHGRKSATTRLDGRRDGDGAEMAIIEFVEEELKAKPKKKRRTTKRATKKVEAAATEEAPAEEATTEEAPAETAEEEVEATEEAAPEEAETPAEDTEEEKKED